MSNAALAKKTTLPEENIAYDITQHSPVAAGQ